MASIRTQIRSDGITRHQIVWRDQDTGKQTSRSFDDAQSADRLLRFLNDNGQSFRLAAKAASVMRSASPRLSVVVSEHIDSLTGIESGSRYRYRRIL
ncbi:hypothetical protein [Arthrobacter sp. HLT1-21]